MPDPLATARSRIRQYMYADGLLEIVSGVNAVLIASIMLVPALVHDQPSRFQVIPAAMAILFLAVVLNEQRLMEAIRQRITYPRLGYLNLVAAPTDEHQRRRRMLLIASVVVSILVPVLLFTFHPHPLSTPTWNRRIPLLFGLVIGVASIVEGIRMPNARRFLVSGPLYISLGYAVSVSPLPSSVANSLGLLGMGIIFLAFGTFALWRFVRTTPVPAA